MNFNIPSPIIYSTNREARVGHFVYYCIFAVVPGIVLIPLAAALGTFVGLLFALCNEAKECRRLVWNGSEWYPSQAAKVDAAPLPVLLLFPFVSLGEALLQAFDDTSR